MPEQRIQKQLASCLVKRSAQNYTLINSQRNNYLASQIFDWGWRLECMKYRSTPLAVYASCCGMNCISVPVKIQVQCININWNIITNHVYHNSATHTQCWLLVDLQHTSPWIDWLKHTYILVWPHNCKDLAKVIVVSNL